MPKKVVTSQSFSEQDLKDVINRFFTEGELIGDGKRNVIKILETEGFRVNVKGFKRPNAVNKVVYRFFRKSKAQRSFEYAYRLNELGIYTPEPLGYLEEYSLLSFGRSYYVSKQLDYDLTYRELNHQKDLDNHEDFLRAFTRFTFSLHEKRINFLDHSPGNTLIKKNGEELKFYLVDINRMKFEAMDFNARMKNFARLSPRDYMLDIMSNEYSKLYSHKSEREIKERMSFYSQKFSSGFEKREQFKKKYYFWRSK